MARSLRRRYEHVSVLIHSECKSAGTLMALAADELIISDTGELGPLDVQLRRPDELGGAPQSGLAIYQAFRVLEENAMRTFKAHLIDIRLGAQLSTRIAAKLAMDLTTEVYEGIYKQIDPVRLGEVQRLIVIAHEYGERISSPNVRDGALAKLVTGYPSHEFVIDREEAAGLFHKVRPPSAEEMDILKLLPEFLFELQFKQTHVVPLAGVPGDEQDDETPGSDPAVVDGQPLGVAPGVAGAGGAERGAGQAVGGGVRDAGAGAVAVAAGPGDHVPAAAVTPAVG